jgi:hypothetical protein
MHDTQRDDGPGDAHAEQELGDRGGQDRGTIGRCRAVQ